MGWGEGTEYYWVVLCKNRGSHNKYNLFSSHAIPLAETDEVSPAPKLGTFTVRCDDCGQENLYSDQDVLRAELEHLDSFTPHSLFHDQRSNAARAIDSCQATLSPGATGKQGVLERVRAVVGPYLRFRRKEDPPPPRWRRKA